MDLHPVAPPQSRRRAIHDAQGRWGAAVQQPADAGGGAKGGGGGGGGGGAKKGAGGGGGGINFAAVIDEARLRSLFLRFDADESGAIDR